MYAAGRLHCPSCFGMRMFFCEAMPRPGTYPECECGTCGYVFAEGVVSDEVRAEAIEKMRAERVRRAAGRRR